MLGPITWHKTGRSRYPRSRPEPPARHFNITLLLRKPSGQCPGWSLNFNSKKRTHQSKLNGRLWGIFVRDRRALASVHRHLRIRDLRARIWRLVLKRRRVSMQFIQLAQVQHVVPSVPEERCPVRSTRVRTNARDLSGGFTLIGMKGERKFQIS